MVTWLDSETSHLLENKKVREIESETNYFESDFLNLNIAFEYIFFKHSIMVIVFLTKVFGCFQFLDLIFFVNSFHVFCPMANKASLIETLQRLIEFSLRLTEEMGLHQYQYSER